MSIQDTFRDAFTNLLAHGLRSGLTMLGIIMGVASLIVMISIVEGGQRWIVHSIERMGTNLLYVWHKRLTVEEQRKFAGRSTGLRYGDMVAIRQRDPSLKVVPIIKLDQGLKAGSRDFSGRVTATSPEYQEVRNFRVSGGRFLNHNDLAEWRRVVVLGHEVADTLFRSESPLRREVKIGDQRFLVVGVMQHKGTIYGTNYDEKIFIPATTAIRRFQGTDKLNSMLLQVPERERMKDVSQHVHSLLVQRHDGVDDVRIRSQGEFLDALDRTLYTFRMMLGGTALVTLLIGGIGIMNIMLVTVTERISEIGLRKAIGARRRDILLQFLVETTFA